MKSRQASKPVKIDMSRDAAVLRAMAISMRVPDSFREIEDRLRIERGLLPVWPDSVERLKRTSATG